MRLIMILHCDGVSCESVSLMISIDIGLGLTRALETPIPVSLTSGNHLIDLKYKLSVRVIMFERDLLVKLARSSC
jgi:hypothetical protein